MKWNFSSCQDLSVVNYLSSSCIVKRERERERERDRERQWEWERVRDSEREWERVRESERVGESEREWEWEGERVREWGRVRESEGEWERVRESEREWERVRESEREWERVRESERERERERERVRGSEREWEGVRESEKEWEKSEKEWESERVREWESERVREWESERVREWESEKREREREREREWERERERERDRVREREREWEWEWEVRESELNTSEKWKNRFSLLKPPYLVGVRQEELSDRHFQMYLGAKTGPLRPFLFLKSTNPAWNHCLSWRLSERSNRLHGVFFGDYVIRGFTIFPNKYYGTRFGECVSEKVLRTVLQTSDLEGHERLIYSDTRECHRSDSRRVRKIFFCTNTSDFVHLLYHRRYCNVKILFRSVTSRALVSHFEMLLWNLAHWETTRDRILPISSLIWEMDRASRYFTSRSENNLWRITLIFESILPSSKIQESRTWDLNLTTTTIFSTIWWWGKKRIQKGQHSYRRLGKLYHLGHFYFRYSIIDDLLRSLLLALLLRIFSTQGKCTPTRYRW